jgi:hypothetical protein
MVRQWVAESDYAAQPSIIRKFAHALSFRPGRTSCIHHAPCHTDPVVMMLDAAGHHDLDPWHILVETLANCQCVGSPMYFKSRIQNDGILSECCAGKLATPQRPEDEDRVAGYASWEGRTFLEFAVSGLTEQPAGEMPPSTPRLMLKYIPRTAD